MFIVSSIQQPTSQSIIHRRRLHNGDCFDGDDCIDDLIMSITHCSLKGIAAILSVNPTPKTFSESFAVLQKLQTFGQITSLQKSREALSSRTQKYDVLFSSPSERSQALTASPFEVRVDDGSTNPKALDPYNIRGLQFRKRPTPTTFVCKLMVEEESEAGQKLQETAERGSVEILDLKLQQSLKEAGAPHSITAGLASFSHPLNKMNDIFDRRDDISAVANNREEHAVQYPIIDHLPRSLVSVYRSGLEKRSPRSYESSTLSSTVLPRKERILQKEQVWREKKKQK